MLILPYSFVEIDVLHYLTMEKAVLKGRGFKPNFLIKNRLNTCAIVRMRTTRRILPIGKPEKSILICFSVSKNCSMISWSPCIGLIRDRVAGCRRSRYSVTYRIESDEIRGTIIGFISLIEPTKCSPSAKSLGHGCSFVTQ